MRGRSVTAAVVALGTVLLMASSTFGQDDGSDVVADLEELFPLRIQDSPLEITSFAGDEWVLGLGDQGQVFVDFVDGAVPDTTLDPAKHVAVASGRYVNSDGINGTLVAIRACGAAPTTLANAAISYYYGAPEASATPQFLADREVITDVVAAGAIDVRVIATEDIVWLMDAADPSVADIVAQLPDPSQITPCLDS